MHRKKVERDLGWEFISLGVCAISLSKGNANESCVPALQLRFLSQRCCIMFLCWVWVQKRSLPLSGGVEQCKEQLPGREEGSLLAPALPLAERNKPLARLGQSFPILKSHI